MELFVLGFAIGFMFFFINKLFRFKRNSLGDDTYERTLKEWQANFEELESKQTDLTLQLEQMRSNLAKNSFNGLPEIKDKLDTLIEEYKLDKIYNKENFQQLTNNMGSFRERLYNNEGKSY